MNKYLIKVEGMAPVKATFEVMAEDENQAYEILEKAPNQLHLRERPNIDMSRIRKSSFSIINTLTGVVELFRRF